MEETNSKEAPKEEKSGNGYAKWIILLLIAVILGVTNPGKDQHVSTVMHQLTKETSYGGGSDAENVGYALGMTLGARIVENSIEVHNYGLFSTGEMHWEGKSRTVTIGILGNAYFIAK